MSPTTTGRLRRIDFALRRNDEDRPSTLGRVGRIAAGVAGAGALAAGGMYARGHFGGATGSIGQKMKAGAGFLKNDATKFYRGSPPPIQSHPGVPGTPDRYVAPAMNQERKAFYEGLAAGAAPQPPPLPDPQVSKLRAENDQLLADSGRRRDTVTGRTVPTMKVSAPKDYRKPWYKFETSMSPKATKRLVALDAKLTRIVSFARNQEEDHTARNAAIAATAAGGLAAGGLYLRGRKAIKDSNLPILPGKGPGVLDTMRAGTSALRGDIAGAAQAVGSKATEVGKWGTAQAERAKVASNAVLEAIKKKAIQAEGKLAPALKH